MSDQARLRLRCGSVGELKSVGAPKTVQTELTLPGSPRAGPPKVPGYHLALVLSALLCCPTPSLAQTTAILQGRVFDPSGAIIAGASITVRNPSTGFTLSVSTDGRGRYLIAAIPAGLYEVTAASPGFQSERLDDLTFEVGRTLRRDFHLMLGDRSEAVVVTTDLPLLDRATSTVGHMVSARTIQEIPLNGRHFVDLGLLVPGSVAPSQTGFSTTPIRGTGALAFNTSGNREEAVGYVVNGVTTNNLTFGSIGFPPPIASIQEFKVDNSTFSAEYGHVSGAVVNLVTRSGSDQFRGSAYEFFRNDALDARNFFEFTSPEPAPFERNQFGGSLGGPIIRGRTLFLRDVRRIATASGTEPEQPGAQRRRARSRHRPRRSPVDRADSPRELFRRRTAFRDSSARPTPASMKTPGRSIFARPPAPAIASSCSGDGSTWQAIEPGSQGTSIPGFGHTRAIVKDLVTVNHTHVFGPALVNEARFGQTGQDGSTLPGRRRSTRRLLGLGTGSTVRWDYRR